MSDKYPLPVQNKLDAAIDECIEEAGPRLEDLLLPLLNNLTFVLAATCVDWPRNATEELLQSFSVEFKKNFLHTQKELQKQLASDKRTPH